MNTYHIVIDHTFVDGKIVHGYRPAIVAPMYLPGIADGVFDVTVLDYFFTRIDALTAFMSEEWPGVEHKELREVTA